MGAFDIADVVERPPSWGEMVRRGIRRECPRCGSGDVFVTRWRLRERCGDCGYKFKREPGFALGAWFLNFMALEIVHMAGALTYIVWLSNHPGESLLVPMLIAGAFAISMPLLTYPYSQTTWAAIDLIMTPMELDEIVEAMDAVGASPGDVSPGDVSPGDVSPRDDAA